MQWLEGLLEWFSFWGDRVYSVVVLVRVFCCVLVFVVVGLFRLCFDDYQFCVFESVDCIFDDVSDVVGYGVERYCFDGVLDFGLYFVGIEFFYVLVDVLFYSVLVDVFECMFDFSFDFGVEFVLVIVLFCVEVFEILGDVFVEVGLLFVEGFVLVGLVFVLFFLVFVGLVLVLDVGVELL